MRNKDDTANAYSNQKQLTDVQMDQNNNRIFNSSNKPSAFSPIASLIWDPKTNALFSKTKNHNLALPTVKSAVQLGLSNASCKYTAQLPKDALTSQDLLNVGQTKSLNCVSNQTTIAPNVYNFKVLVIGEMASGKSSYIQKLSPQKKTARQPKDYYKATVSSFHAHMLFIF